MYILISDFKYQRNPSYFFARGEWLERIKKYYPNYADILNYIIFCRRRPITMK